MTKWQITTEPTIEPITLTEAKLHLRVDGTDDDALITSLIKAARQLCEEYQNRAYITQTITWKLDGFPCEFTVPRPKLQSVTSIKYIDANGTQQTLVSSIYDVDIYSEPARIVLAYGQVWPLLRGDINSVEVIFKAGYGDTADKVPDRIKAAIKLLIGHLYEHREDVSTLKHESVPFGVTSLLSVDRVFI
jgi:uncharacterized phiE125 gp8 family phage protein